MSTAHKCPTCDGTKQSVNPRTREFGPCITCDTGSGPTGVVYERDQPQEAAAVGSSPLDINGL